MISNDGLGYVGSIVERLEQGATEGNTRPSSGHSQCRRDAADIRALLNAYEIQAMRLARAEAEASSQATHATVKRVAGKPVAAESDATAVPWLLRRIFGVCS